MFIAVLSLVTSMYNGYLNDKMVDIIHSTARPLGIFAHLQGDHRRLFPSQVPGQLVAENSGRAREGSSGVPVAQIEAANAVNKFAAMGTYLANLADEAAREKYTHLSWELRKGRG